MWKETRCSFDHKVHTTGFCIWRFDVFDVVWCSTFFIFYLTFWCIWCSEMFKIFHFWLQDPYNWYVDVLVVVGTNSKILLENSHYWKLSKLEVVSIKNCQNWKLQKLEIAKTESWQDWKLPKLKVISVFLAKS